MHDENVLATVILDDPLYKKRAVNGRLLIDMIGRFKPINYVCSGECKSLQTFGLVTVNKDDPNNYRQNLELIGRLDAMHSGPVRLEYVENTAYHLEFCCLKCGKYRALFTLILNYEPDKKDSRDDSKGTTTILKTGQYPPFEAAIDPDVEKWLSKSDKAIYKKGLRSEANGFGIGAFGYFRRITENNIEKLLDQVAATSDSQKLINAVANAKKQHNAEERLKIVKDHAPGSYSFNGQNVFKILYTALSEGLHQDTDEECLDSATSVRACLDFLIKRVNRATQEQKELASSIKKLTTKN